MPKKQDKKNQEQEKQQQKKQKQNDKFDRKILFDYLLDQYSIIKMPKQFFVKMSNIFNGKLQGLKQPIPPEHVYDMWQQKMNYLNKIHHRNQQIGKKMDNYNRLNYDLSIIINKYDDYLGWLDKQKAVRQKEEGLKDVLTRTNVLYNSDKGSASKSNKVDKNNDNSNASGNTSQGLSKKDSLSDDDISDILDDLI